MTTLKPLGQVVAFAREVQPRLDKLRETTQGVEAIFLKDLLAQMRRSVPKSTVGSAMGGEMYRDMFDQAIADKLSKGGSLGISKLLERQMVPNAMRQEWARHLLEQRQKATTSDPERL